MKKQKTLIPAEHVVDRKADPVLMAEVSRRIAENTQCKCGCGRGLTSIAERVLGRNECCKLPEDIIHTSAWGPILEGCPMSLSCWVCDCDADLLEAIDEDWREISFNEHGTTFFSGICPECWKEDGCEVVSDMESPWRPELRKLPGLV